MIRQLSETSGWIAGFYVGLAVTGDESKVWLGAPTGEAGDFDRAAMQAAITDGVIANDVAGAISKFFWENF